MFLQVVVLTFGYITWGQFGWRTYSKLAADMRIKDADQQRKSFVLVNCFTTLLKLDIQVRAVGSHAGTQAGPRHSIHEHIYMHTNKYMYYMYFADIYIRYRCVCVCVYVLSRILVHGLKFA